MNFTVTRTQRWKKCSTQSAFYTPNHASNFSLRLKKSPRSRVKPYACTIIYFAVRARDIGNLSNLRSPGIYEWELHKNSPQRVVKYFHLPDTEIIPHVFQDFLQSENSQLSGYINPALGAEKNLPGSRNFSLDWQFITASLASTHRGLFFLSFDARFYADQLRERFHQRPRALVYRIFFRNTLCAQPLCNTFM